MPGLVPDAVPGRESSLLLPVPAPGPAVGRRPPPRYVEGEVAGRPRPPWIAGEARLASAGRLVRAYDDAAALFTLRRAR